jgi:hypothetical protein
MSRVANATRRRRGQRVQALKYLPKINCRYAANSAAQDDFLCLKTIRSIPINDHPESDTFWRRFAR